MAAYESLEMVGTVAVVVNALVLAVVVGLGTAALVVLRRTAGRNLDQMAEHLPKVVPLIQASELDMAVLVAVCEEKGTTAEQLAAFYKEDSDRKAIVIKRFGDSALVRRFLNWGNSEFLAKGYPAEPFLAEFLNKANPNAPDNPGTPATGATPTPDAKPAPKPDDHSHSDKEP